jgi:hypothetical protein
MIKEELAEKHGKQRFSRMILQTASKKIIVDETMKKKHIDDEIVNFKKSFTDFFDQRKPKYFFFCWLEQ